MPRLALTAGILIALLCLTPPSVFGQGRSRYVAFDRPVATTPTTVAPPAPAAPPSTAYPVPAALMNVDLAGQSAEDAMAKSAGCIACHGGTHDPHGKDTVRLGCTDCHGGNAASNVKQFAHVQPRFPDVWRTSANPVRSYTLLNHETPEFTRFVNPGDLRTAHLSCGTTGCHPNEVLNNRKSMMTHGAMLWEAALYNNGGLPPQARPLRRELQHVRHPPADADRAAADAV